MAQPLLAVLLRAKAKPHSQKWLWYKNKMTFYSRNLPHWHPEGAALFLTWRLYGSLSASVRNFRNQDRTARSGCATKDSPEKRFKLIDNLLDKCSTGPHWLKDPRIAASVLETIHRGEFPLNHYALHAFVIMPNHVHLLISPKAPVPQITNGIKGVSARDANRILGGRGKHFWQDESFDHWVRSSHEFEHIRAYIEFNPVSAGLAAHPEEWPWSSASRLTTAASSSGLPRRAQPGVAVPQRKS